MSENIVQDEKIQNSYQKQFLYFKNDLLKDINNIESKLNSKLNETKNILDAKLNDYEIKISLLSEKINHFSQLISHDKKIDEKIIKLEKYNEKINESLLNNEMKIDSIKYDLKNSINKYDNLFLENIFCPGLIGNSNKYKTFRELLDYILSQIRNLNSFKDTNNIDFKTYKVKLDNSIQNFKFQFDGINRTLKEYTNKQFYDCEEKIKNNFNILENKIKDIQTENNQNLNELNNKIENIDINKQFIIPEKKEENEFNNNLLNKFNNIQNDFNLIKRKFTQLSEFIKDVRFRTNLSEDIKKRDLINISKEIDFSKKNPIQLPNDQYNNYVKYFKNNIQGFILRKKSNDSIPNISDFDKNKNNHLKKTINENMENNNIENNKILNNTKYINFNNNNLNIEDNNIIENKNNDLPIKSQSEKKKNNLENKEYDNSNTNNNKTSNNAISNPLLNEDNINLTNNHNYIINNKKLNLNDKISVNEKTTNIFLKFNSEKTYTNLIQNDKNKNLSKIKKLSNEGSISLKNIFNNTIGINKKENLEKIELVFPNSQRENNLIKISNNNMINLKKNKIISFSHDNIFKTNIPNNDSNSNNSDRFFKEIKLNYNNKNDNKIKNIKNLRIKKYLKEIKPKIPNYNELYNKYSENNSYINNNELS